MDHTHLAPRAEKPVQLMAFKVVAEGETLDLDVYETIGESYWGDSISAKDVLGKLRDERPKVINIRINSGGGDLFDGIAIHNLLRASGASISVTVDGVAASAASIIMIAADPGKLTIASGAFVMIHEARGGVWGTASDLDGAANLIRKANATMSEMYSRAAGKRGVDVDSKTFSALMAEETWFTGEEAMLVGLADKVGETPALAASIDLAAFRKTPTQLLARETVMKPSTTQASTAVPKEQTMNVELQAALDAHKAELAALNSAHTLEIQSVTKEKDTLEKASESIRIENEALKTQNSALAAERDKAIADVSARDAKLLEAEIDALVPAILDPAERDNFVALAKTSRPLFDSMIAQRKPRSLTSQLVSTDLDPSESNSAVGADAKFDELVAEDLK